MIEIKKNPSIHHFREHIIHTVIPWGDFLSFQSHVEEEMIQNNIVETALLLEPIMGWLEVNETTKGRCHI